MHELQTHIDIDATPERVWSILTDFAAYPEWNPFILSAHGVAQNGQKLAILVQPDGGKAMRFRPDVLSAEAPRELRWLGRLILPGIFDGEHRFLIEPLEEGGVRFTQSERFSGVLVPLFRKSLDNQTKRGFEAMNAALKTRAQNDI